MKQIFPLLFILLAPLLLAKPNIIVSITPQKTFVQKITQDMANITVMVPPGSSPHSYEPKPSQMMALSNADVYFSIGVEFEKVWSQKFQSQNANLPFVDISANVKKIAFAPEHHHEEDEHKDEEHHHTGMDPHTWLSPKNVAIMAQTIYESLVKISPKNRAAYKKNLDLFLQELHNTDTQIKEILKDLPPKTKFMVFHPSWGYFAEAYGLEQISIEVEGKSPRPKEIINIIKEAKEEQVKVIFTQAEFSDKSAKIIANELNIPVVKSSPLKPNYSQNLIKMAKIIAK